LVRRCRLRSAAVSTPDWSGQYPTFVVPSQHPLLNHSLMPFVGMLVVTSVGVVTVDSLL